MARVLRQWMAPKEPCSYLGDREALLEYRLMLDVSPEEWDGMLALGWRRFGPAYFRPACPACLECVPIRVPVSGFRPSRQQRRARNKFERLRVVIGTPRVDAARLALYARWHEERAQIRGWRHEDLRREEYELQFAFPCAFAREFAYYDPDGGASAPRLVGVAIVDETPLALSAVYTYHDPEYASWSLGTGSIVYQIEEARRRGKRWVYLGYRISGCPSSRYKARYRPHELLLPVSAGSKERRWTVETAEPLTSPVTRSMGSER